MKHVRLTALAAAVVAAGSLAACSRGHKLAQGEGRLISTGRTLVTPVGKPAKYIGHSYLLHAGDRVEIRTGDAKLDVANGGRFEFQPLSSFTFDAAPFLQTG